MNFKMQLSAGTALVQRFRKTESGATALTFGVALTVLMGAIGMGMDINIASKEKLKAQNIADAVALNAATFYRDNERRPNANDEGAFLHNKWYNARDIGYEFSGFVNEQVSFKVQYDIADGEARALVRGHTKTTFSSFLGKDKVFFKARTTAKFAADRLVSPVSVIVVADNSGSMHFDDMLTIETKTPGGSYQTYGANGRYGTDADGNATRSYDSAGEIYTTPVAAEPRIESLKRATETFVEIVENTAGDQDVGERTIRQGLLPYSSQILTPGRRDIDWGFISGDENSGDIGSMQPSGSTNSAPPMQQTRRAMADENTRHRAETGKYPLKFVLFMTDGMNTARTWIPEDGTDMWRPSSCAPTSEEASCEPYQNTAPNTVYSENDLRAYGYNEGAMHMLADQQTLEACTQMKNEGVRIFTIGFALQDGTYYTNDWDGGATDGWGNRDKSRFLSANYDYIGPEVAEQANALLQGCASRDTDFVLADNAEDLDRAFKEIGVKIEKEIIRVSR